MSFARSIARITVAVIVLGATGLAGLAAVLRQPAITSLPFRGARRADARALEQHVRFLTEDVRPRSAAHPENLDRAAAYIADAFRAAGARTTVQPFDARGKRYANVVGEFGSGDDPLIVVGAHYDAFGETGDLPGADDNASGTAGLLELARLLEEPPFFGSEQMGSAVHANGLARAKEKVDGMICLEMIGCFSKEQAWPNWLFELVYPSTGDFIGVAGGWNDRRLARVVKRAIAGAGGIRVVSFTGPRETADASDQRNYWSHGWPAVMVSDTAFLRNPNYHTARDTADTLDYARMARVIDGVLNAVLHLATF